MAVLCAQCWHVTCAWLHVPAVRCLSLAGNLGCDPGGSAAFCSIVMLPALLAAWICRHLASSEGAYQVTEWLLTQGVDVNALDRFKRTPLEVRARHFCCHFGTPSAHMCGMDRLTSEQRCRCALPRRCAAQCSSHHASIHHAGWVCHVMLQDAVRGEFREVAKLLSDNGGRIHEDGGLVRMSMASCGVPSLVLACPLRCGCSRALQQVVQHAALLGCVQLLS